MTAWAVVYVSEELVITTSLCLLFEYKKNLGTLAGQKSKVSVK